MPSRRFSSVQVAPFQRVPAALLLLSCAACRAPETEEGPRAASLGASPAVFSGVGFG